MDKQEKFEEIYQKLLNENIYNMENYRNEAKTQDKRNKRINKFMTLAVGVPLSLFIILLVILSIFLPYGKQGNTIILWFSGIYAIATLIICFIVFTRPKKFDTIDNYKKKFKDKIINTIIKCFDETLEYQPEKGISRSTYRDAKFNMFEASEFETKYSDILDQSPNLDDSYFSDDLICGDINESCKLVIAEIYSRTTKSSGSFRIFEGMFAKIETPKAFNESIYIRENKKEVSFPELKIQLDSEEFEKVFDVYASNKIIALQLLTSDIMQELLDFYHQMKIPCEITITNNNIYIEFSCGKLFETPNLSKFSLDKENLYKYYRILDFTFEISNMLVKLIDNTQYE